MKTNFYTKKAVLSRALRGALILLTVLTARAQQWTPKDPTNIALHKPAKQSSVFEVAAANRAVDGNTNGHWGQRSVTHTHGGNNPWWEVDLLGVYDISSITIYNRTDAAPERLNNFTIRVSDHPLKGRIGGQVINPADRNFFRGSKTFNANARGQYVSIQIEGNGILSLAEVVIKGTPVSVIVDKNTNLALGKSTRQSSVFDYGSSNKANDGNTNGNWNFGSVTHTNNDNRAFWEVDLGKNYLIEEVKIWNRTDCCQDRLKNFDIFVTDKPYDDVRGRLDPYATQDQNTLPRDRQSYTGIAFGRYVRVQLNGSNNLNLAEVEVFGKELGELNTSISQISREVYRVSKYDNGLPREWPQESELAVAVSEGYDFNDTSEQTSSNWWETSVEVSTSVSILLHEFDVTVGAKGGGNTSNTTINSIRQNIQLSETETKKDVLTCPPNSTVYKFVKFRLVEKPFEYTYKGNKYRFQKVLSTSKPIGQSGAYAYPLNFDPGLEMDEDQFISEENYQKIISNYESQKLRSDDDLQKSQNTTVATNMAINNSVSTATSGTVSNPPANVPNTANSSAPTAAVDTNTTSTMTAATPKVSQVEYCDGNGNPIGYFTLVDGVWMEHDVAGNVSNEFSEGSRDASEIVLNDLNRGGVVIKLDLANKRIWYSDNNNNPFELYTISTILKQ